MKTLSQKARLLLCSLIILAYFIPSYNGISGFSFVSLAFSEPEVNSDITSTDVLILIIPLLFTPLSALVLLLISSLKIPARKIYMAMPLTGIVAFVSILVLASGNGSGNFSNLSFLLQMGGGFYLALTASFLLPFTKNPHRKRVKKRKTSPPLEIAA